MAQGKGAAFITEAEEKGGIGGGELRDVFQRHAERKQQAKASKMLITEPAILPDAFAARPFFTAVAQVVFMLLSTQSTNTPVSFIC